MIKFYNVKDSVKDDNKLQESQIKEIEVNNEEDLKPLTAVEISTTQDNGKIEKTDKQSFEDFKNMYKGVIDLKCNQEYGSNEDKDLWEDTAKELYLNSKEYILQGDEHKPESLEKKTEGKKVKSKEEMSFQQIIDMMEYADTYGELYNAAQYIADDNLRKWVTDELIDCEDNNDPVDVAYSVVTSDFLDSMVGKPNVKSSKKESKIPTHKELVDANNKKLNESLDLSKFGEIKGEQETIPYSDDEYGEEGWVHEGYWYTITYDGEEICSCYWSSQDGSYTRFSDFDLNALKEYIPEDYINKIENELNGIFDGAYITDFDQLINTVNNVVTKYVTKGSKLNEDDSDDGYVYVHTGLSDDKTEYILNSVIGQISDGIWEGSRGMDKIWQYMDVEKMNDELVMKVYTKYPSGFEGKTEDQISKYVAQKIKQIAKINIDHQNVRSMDGSPAQWDRNETATLTYFGGKDDDPITVRDAYKVYDSILGKKQRIESKQLESRDRVAENLSKFVYDLTTDKDTEAYGETAWSGNQPTKMGNGVTVYEVYKNGKSNYTMDDIKKAVIERFPELDVYGTAYNSILFYKPQKTESKLQEDTIKSTLNTNLNESNIDKYNTIPEIKDRLKEINKQLAYIRRRDSVSLSIGTEQEQEELRSEKAKLNGRLRKLRNNAVDMDKMTSEQQKEFKQRLKDLQLLDDDESNLQSAIQSYRNHYIQEFESYTKKEENNTDLEYRYMLLDRLRSDCDYFLGYGNGSERHLWAGNIDDQIAKMKELYNSFTDDQKPEWITMEDINNYEKEMKELKKGKEKKTEDSTNNKLDNSYNDFLHFGLDFIDIWFSPYEWYKDPEKAKEYWYNIPYSYILDYIDKEFNDYDYYKVKEACEKSDVAKKRLQEVWKEYVARYVKDYNPTAEKIYQNYVNKILDRDLYPTKTDDLDNIKYPEEMFLNFTKELKNKVGIDEAIDLLYNSYDYGRHIYCIDKQGYEYTYKIKDTEVKVRDNKSIKRAESELRTAKSVLDKFLSSNTDEETKRYIFRDIQDLDNKIDYIMYFYKQLPEKPDWLSLEDIDDYREKGKNILNSIHKKTEVTEKDIDVKGKKDELVEDINNEYNSLPIGNITITVSEQPNNSVYLEIQDKNNTTISDMFIKDQIQTIVNFLNRLLSDNKNKPVKEESAISDYTLSEINKVLSSNGNDFTIKIVNSNEDAETKTLNIDREDLISIYNVLGGNKDELTESRPDKQAARDKMFKDSKMKLKLPNKFKDIDEIVSYLEKCDNKTDVMNVNVSVGGFNRQLHNDMLQFADKFIEENGYLDTYIDKDGKEQPGKFKEFKQAIIDFVKNYNLKTESKTTETYDLDKIENSIKDETLSDAAKFLGMLINGDSNSFKVQGSELINTLDPSFRIMCSVEGNDKIKSIVKDFTYTDNELKKKEEKLNDYVYVIYRRRLVKAPVYVKDYSTETEDINEAITFPTEQEAEEYKNELELSYKEQYKIGVKD